MVGLVRHALAPTPHLMSHLCMSKSQGEPQKGYMKAGGDEEPQGSEEQYGDWC